MAKVMFWTSDPVRDAEMYAIDDRPVLGECDECGKEIHSQNADYYGDDAYLFEDGDLVCSDCLRKYCDEHFRI